MKHLTESLAGRIGLLNLLPISTNEYLNWTTKKYIDPLNLFIQTCLRGSYPELIIEKNFNASDWFLSYIQTYCMPYPNQFLCYFSSSNKTKLSF